MLAMADVWTFVWPLLVASEWRQATFITNVDISLDKAPPLKMSTFNCKEHPLGIIEHLRNIIKEGDYNNILIRCNKNVTTTLMQHLWDGEKDGGTRYNILIVSEEGNYTVPFHSREGDNVAFLSYHNYHDIKSTNIDYPPLLNRRQRKPQLVSMRADVSWCLGGCLYTGYHRREVLRNVSQATELVIMPATFAGFQGREMRVVLCVGVVYADVSINSQNETVLGSGIMSNTLKILSDKFDFRVKIKSMARCSYGNPVNVSYTSGNIGAVQRGEFDFFLAGTSDTALRNTVVDFLYPVRYNFIVFAVWLKFEKNDYLLGPFSTTVWYLTITLPILMALFISLTGCLTEQTPQAVLNNAFNSLQMFLGQGAPKGFRYIGLYTSLMVYVISLVALIGVYIGNLTASLAVSNPVWPFRSVRELSLKTEYNVKVRADTAQQNFLKNSKDPGFQRIWEKVAANPDVSLLQRSEQFDQETDTSVWFASMGRLMRKKNGNGWCDLRHLPTRFNQSPLSIVIREGAPFKRHFNRVILNIHEAGLIEHWLDLYEPRAACDAIKLSVDELTLQDSIYIYIYLLSVPLCVSFLALMTECVVSRTHITTDSWFGTMLLRKTPV